MLDYRTPGVYVETLEPPPSIGIARTDIAGFVGIAERGPLHRPVKVTSFSQFQALFGRHIAHGYLAYAVEGFFLNRGAECWVVRVDDPKAAAAAGIEVFGADNRALLRLEASSEGYWGNEVRVRVIRRGTTFDLLVKLGDGSEQRINDPPSLLLAKSYPFLAPEPQQPEIEVFMPTVVKPPSNPAARYKAGPGEISILDASEKLLTGGASGVALTYEHFIGGDGEKKSDWGLAGLGKIREVALVAIPDLMAKQPPPEPRPPRRPRCESLNVEPVPVSQIPPPPPPRNLDENTILEAQHALMVHCERLQDRFAVLDAKRLRSVADLEKWRRDNVQSSSYAALYAPWIFVDDPLRIDGPVRLVPPSGHVSGLIARVERRRRVHKPPANEILEGARSLMIDIGDSAHGDLNVAGINAIRVFPGRGIRVAGERTLSDELNFRYVNVRRLIIMIRRAIEADTQWLPFEPNNPDLRLEVDRVVRSFLLGLFQLGMLDGATAEEAFSVACDDTTNTESSTAEGRLICEIGVRPPWPAEFIRIVIAKTLSGLELIQELEGPNA